MESLQASYIEDAIHNLEREHFEFKAHNIETGKEKIFKFHSNKASII